MIHQKIKDLFASSLKLISPEISKYSTNPDTDFLRNKKILYQNLISQGSSSTNVELLDFWGIDTAIPSSSAAKGINSYSKWAPIPKASNSPFLETAIFYIPNCINISIIIISFCQICNLSFCRAMNHEKTLISAVSWLVFCTGQFSALLS